MHIVQAGADLNLLFREARTFSRWLDKPVPETILRALYDLLRYGPTSANASPGRFVFAASPAAKEKLKPCLLPGNVAQTMAAPVTAIVAHDLDFPETLPRLFPHADARAWFAGNDALVESTAFRNGTLQGAYLIMAARALGLDCGPMSGFDGAMVDRLFFAGTRIRSNFLVNIGYGDRAVLHPRSPRLAFEDACRIE